MARESRRRGDHTHLSSKGRVLQDTRVIRRGSASSRCFATGSARSATSYPAVGIEASHLSQQLAVLRRANLVQTRKEGTSVLYSVGNPMIFELLDVARRILTSSLDETRALLAELELPESQPAPRSARRR